MKSRVLPFNSQLSFISSSPSSIAPPLSSTYLIYDYYLLLCFRFVLGFQWGSNSAKIEVSYSLRFFLFFWLYSLSLFALNIQIILILVFIFCNTRSTILSVCFFNFFFSDKFYFTGLTRIEAIQSALQLRK